MDCPCSASKNCLLGSPVPDASSFAALRPHCANETIIMPAAPTIHLSLPLKELDEEFNRSTRLQSKFFWVREPEYQQDRRKGLLTPSTNDKAKIIKSRLFV